MGRRFAMRLLGSLGAIFGASIISFVFLRVAPGDPVRLIIGPQASPAAIAGLRRELRLDQPLVVQYWHYITDFVRGDWGFSFSNGQQVSTLISDRLPASIELAVAAFLIAVTTAVVLSVAATYRPRRGSERAVRAFTSFGLGTPAFWLALLLLIVFFVNLHVLPGPEGQLSRDVATPPNVTGFVVIDALLEGDWTALGNALEHLVLPAIALAAAPAALLTRMLYSNMAEVSREPFLLTVRSKGVNRWRTSVRHTLPNGVLPTLTAAGPVFAELLGGSVFIETVFNWPGVGQLAVQSISRQDYSVVQALVLLSAATYVVLNLLIDYLAGVIDPRVRAPSAVQ